LSFARIWPFFIGIVVPYFIFMKTIGWDNYVRFGLLFPICLLLFYCFNWNNKFIENKAEEIKNKAIDDFVKLTKEEKSFITIEDRIAQQIAAGRDKAYQKKWLDGLGMSESFKDVLIERAHRIAQPPFKTPSKKTNPQ
jgi:hypothetical protein